MRGNTKHLVFCVCVASILLCAFVGGAPARWHVEEGELVHAVGDVVEPGKISTTKSATLSPNKTFASDQTYDITTIVKSSTPPVVYSPYTTIPPTIDGILSKNEWGSPAITKTLNYINCITGQNETHEMIVFFMNDATHLYIAIKITNEDFESADVQEGDVDVIEIYFDNNNNGIIEPNEDIKNFWNLQYGDWFYK